MGGKPGDSILCSVFMFYVFWNALRKSFQVPNVTAMPTMTFLWKMLAKVKADPLVMHEKVKSIFFALVL